ncbi:MAG TPA: GxxExxY protein [Methylomusa anaerophila]|uniref:GxxExxY protein n=1 Tax=Methylomusa anaerophila TaxID=1930071 RepID=A0A348AKL0_9FIRM|nr:GxxExxY protein [Methylomusa anaerophila]BBB91608.1 hypothetical protein MAMMFC1_02292 [Methylomusa anaerophila]HML89454.1 GxxExxY protein [Methylomusa anaerophila]
MDKGHSNDDMVHLTEKIIGAAIEVHRVLGPGYAESVYEEAMATELTLKDIPFERQKKIRLNYKGHVVGEGRLDLFVDNKVIVELKAIDCISAIHTAQLLSYLKMINMSLGLLINFNVSTLRQGIKRVILSK